MVDGPYLCCHFGAGEEEADEQSVGCRSEQKAESLGNPEPGKHSSASVPLRWQCVGASVRSTKSLYKTPRHGVARTRVTTRHHQMFGVRCRRDSIRPSNLAQKRGRQRPPVSPFHNSLMVTGCTARSLYHSVGAICESGHGVWNPAGGYVASCTVCCTDTARHTQMRPFNISEQHTGALRPLYPCDNCGGTSDKAEEEGGRACSWLERATRPPRTPFWTDAKESAVASTVVLQCTSAVTERRSAYRVAAAVRRYLLVILMTARGGSSSDNLRELFTLAAAPNSQRRVPGTPVPALVVRQASPSAMLACTTPVEQLVLQAPSRRLRNGDSCWRACPTANSPSANSPRMHEHGRPGLQQHSVVTPDPVPSAKPSIPAINLCRLPLGSAASREVPAIPGVTLVPLKPPCSASARSHDSVSSCPPVVCYATATPARGAHCGPGSAVCCPVFTCAWISGIVLGSDRVREQGDTHPNAAI
ncbi:hypothetical protein K458DRAFT_459338 [Lentithecium fluviatile CBS 122367]|uniref:Uncharacterized protein n=1 Tax=Lentithecium fluviatile CBS 122367 TaxID=1168545 RepID=A0A6G1JIJ6_9PLEO|nr:hypothetical protein K458DRAFT_459338 [Lentithecium fluviatile CBS 122367]